MADLVAAQPILAVVQQVPIVAQLVLAAVPPILLAEQRPAMATVVTVPEHPAAARLNRPVALVANATDALVHRRATSKLTTAKAVAISVANTRSAVSAEAMA